ncbi:hypothetical protein B0T17DRAFT_602977 [Bombardia bombarda]|uniref:Uncharacterized protein n=1 Tax=Bombardia bombarda TaxID=252184 RepID=A0AA39TMD5_9PEZI|nr:hypothetical protein B0T17DRAFT_602977 [Bombardia bombarda]
MAHPADLITRRQSSQLHPTTETSLYFIFKWLVDLPDRPADFAHPFDYEIEVPSSPFEDQAISMTFCHGDDTPTEQTMVDSIFNAGGDASTGHTFSIVQVSSIAPASSLSSYSSFVWVDDTSLVSPPNIVARDDRNSRAELDVFSIPYEGLGVLHILKGWVSIGEERKGEQISKGVVWCAQGVTFPGVVGWKYSVEMRTCPRVNHAAGSKANILAAAKLSGFQEIVGGFCHCGHQFV